MYTIDFIQFLDGRYHLTIRDNSGEKVCEEYSYCYSYLLSLLWDFGLDYNFADVKQESLTDYLSKNKI